MKALRLHGINDLRIEDVAAPKPAADEVLLKVLTAGICGSDLPRVFSKGAYHYPIILGHEFAGEITEAGEGVDPSLVGKMAAVFPLLPCFTCKACKEGHYASCANYDYYGSRRDGAFAEYIAVKVWNLVLVPEGVPVSWAAMAEPCAVAVHAAGKADIRKGDAVCIFGAGAIGLVIAQIARSKGAIPILVDIDEKKLDAARGLGFEHALNSRDGGDPDGERGPTYLDSIMDLTGGQGADICIEGAGASVTLTGCVKASAAFATVVLMGNPAGDMLIKQDDYSLILRKQLRISGTWNSDYSAAKNDWETALQYMKDSVIDLSGLITHVFPLEEGREAFALAKDPDEFSIKVLIAPHGGAL